MSGTEMAFKEMDDRLEAARTEIVRLRARVKELEAENVQLKTQVVEWARKAYNYIYDLRIAMPLLSIAPATVRGESGRKE